MVITNPEKVIREYLTGVVHLSLATCVNNYPWICEVHFAVDRDLNLYFRSRTIRRHSKEIAENKQVAGNIVEQHVVDQETRGVYFEGEAMLLEHVDESHPGYVAYSQRFGVGKEILEEANEINGHTFYKIAVDTFYLFDTRESDPGKKYELPWLKKRN